MIVPASDLPPEISSSEPTRYVVRVVSTSFVALILASLEHGVREHFHAVMGGK